MKTPILIAITCLGWHALGATEIGPRVPQPDREPRAQNPAPNYTPRSGYFGDLTLIGSPTSGMSDDEIERVLVRLLELIREQRRLRSQLSALDPSNKELDAERDTIRLRQGEVSLAITRLLAPLQAQKAPSSESPKASKL